MSQRQINRIYQSLGEIVMNDRRYHRIRTIFESKCDTRHIDLVIAIFDHPDLDQKLSVLKDEMIALIIIRLGLEKAKQLIDAPNRVIVMNYRRLFKGRYICETNEE